MSVEFIYWYFGYILPKIGGYISVLTLRHKLYLCICAWKKWEHWDTAKHKSGRKIGRRGKKGEAWHLSNSDRVHMIGDRDMVISLILSLHKTHCTHTISIFFWYFGRPNSCKQAFVEIIKILQIKFCIYFALQKTLLDTLTYSAMWLRFYAGRPFEDTFENTQWKKAKKMQPM